MISFDALYLLYAAPIIALMVTLLAFWARAARVNRATAWSREMGSVAARTGRGGVITLGVVALFAGLALAGPKFGRRTVTTESKALTLVIAVDVSRSMLAEDVRPSRLGRARQEARRLIQDLQGDRLGLIAFAGRSFILSPLTVDDGALQLLVDGLDPDMVSAGGSEIAVVLDQGRQLLMAGPAVADRVLVVITDGEAHDSIPAIVDAAERLRRENVRLILVAEGGVDPVTIPQTDAAGNFVGFQEDLLGNTVQTRRRDDILEATADAAKGELVPSELGNQARAVRELVDSYKRAPQATTTAAQDISRAWIPMVIAVLLLLAQTITRRTAALAALSLLVVGPSTASAQRGSNPADEAWRDSAFGAAADLYREQALANQGGDTAWYNFGTVAMALGDSARAIPALARAAQSLDPDLRFRAVFNLGWLALRRAAYDEENREQHLAQARRHYREALLLRPHDEDAKWNYELATQPPPDGDGGGSQSPPPPRPQPQPDGTDPLPQGLTREQAEQILNSMLAEERETQDALNRRRGQPVSATRRKNW